MTLHKNPWISAQDVWLKMITSRTSRDMHICSQAMHSVCTPASFARSCVKCTIHAVIPSNIARNVIWAGSRMSSYAKFNLALHSIGRCSKCYLGEATYIKLCKIAKLLDPPIFQRLTTSNCIAATIVCSTLHDSVAWTTPFAQA